jgi:error-prone DNA polymerase
MVHPYLRRRDELKTGKEPDYPSPHPSQGDKGELKDVLKRTLGVPLFQEQAMQIAITAAKFTPDEADGLRRAMATFRHNGTVHLFRDKFINGMVSRGYDPDFAENCFSQIEGFGEYGFPESHAASFALLVYASAWIKCRYPDVFCAAILNSQPMGFYQPAQLVRDARQHNVEIRAVDVNFSDWDCTLEQSTDESHAVRLGFRLIYGLREEEMEKLVAARGNGYSSIERLAAVAGISRATIERLAEADAFRSLDLDRRAALWAARRLDRIGIASTVPKPHAEEAAQRPSKDEPEDTALRGPALSRRAPQGDERDALPLLKRHMSDELFPEPTIALPAMPLSEHVVEDYVATGLSLKEHPVRFFRARLTALGVIENTRLRGDDLRHEARVTVAGLVLVRQRPGTAKGVIFMTLEDETDIANIIVWPKAFEKNRRIVMTARFLAVRGRLQRAGLVIHIVAEKFIDLSAELPWLREGGDLFSPKFSGGPPPKEAPADNGKLFPSPQPSAHPLDAKLLKSRDFH